MVAGQQDRSGTGRGGSGARTAAGADRLDRQARGRAALRRGGERRRRPLLPVLGQRRVRRPALRPRPHLHPARARAGAADRTARRASRRSAPGHPGPRPVQPRPARAGRHAASPWTASRPRRSRRQPAGAEVSGAGVLAGAGRPAAELGAGRPAAAQAQGRAGPSRSSSSTAAPPPGPTDIEGVLYGWVTTRDGAMVANEPDGAMTWYPVSDHPTDKATYCFEITVPEGKVAVANGLPRARADHRRRLDDLVLGRPRPAGELPVDRVGRRLRPPGVRDGRRPAGHRRGRRRPAAARPGDDERQPRPAGRDHRVPRDVRPVPVQLRRRDRRRRLRRLRAGDPDPADLLPGRPARARSSTSSRTSGSATR